MSLCMTAGFMKLHSTCEWTSWYCSVHTKGKIQLSFWKDIETKHCHLLGRVIHVRDNNKVFLGNESSFKFRIVQLVFKVEYLKMYIVY